MLPQDPDETISRITRRIERITKRAEWQGRLIRELGETRAELAAMRDLAAAYQRALYIDPDDQAPPQLIEAWSVPGPCLHPVVVDIDGNAVTLVVTGPTPLGMRDRDWRKIKEAHRQVHHDVEGAP